MQIWIFQNTPYSNKIFVKRPSIQIWISVAFYLPLFSWAASRGVIVCRCQYFAGGIKRKGEAHYVEQPLWISIFAWSLILLGSVGIFVVSNSDLTSGSRGSRRKIKIKAEHWQIDQFFFFRHRHYSSGCLCPGPLQVANSHPKLWTIVQFPLGTIEFDPLIKET